MKFLDDLLAAWGNGQTPFAQDQMQTMQGGGMPIPDFVNAPAPGLPSMVGSMPRTPMPLQRPMLAGSGNTEGMSRRPPAAVVSGPEPVMADLAAPSFATTLSGALQGASEATGPLGALLGGIGGAIGANDAVTEKNQTFRLLKARGLSDVDAALAIKNPQYMQHILTQISNKDAPLSKAEELDLQIKQAQLEEYKNAGGKPTNEMREYAIAKQQGFTGSFMDYQMAMKKAGAASTQIKMDSTFETEENKERGKGLAARFNKIAEDGLEARKDGVLFGRMMDLAQNVDPGVKTAIFEEIRSMTGIKLDPNADNVQAFTALQNYLAPRMRVPGSGASSDRDVAMFFSALPSLKGTPEGNRIISETFQGVNEARAAAAEIAAAYQRKEITSAEADAKIKAIPDPYEKFKKAETARREAAAGKLPTVTNPTEALKLGPGKKFIYNGVIMQNPGGEK